MEKGGFGLVVESVEWSVVVRSSLTGWVGVLVSHTSHAVVVLMQTHPPINTKVTQCTVRAILLSLYVCLPLICIYSPTVF
jgi:hypothetical protein